jgi:hypothetical protein
MIPLRFALLIPIAALVGCGAGRTIRVAEGDSPASEPVALAPTPASGPASPSDTASTAAAAPAQGYAPYGRGNAGILDVRRIGQWSHTGIGEARRMVIRDANGWAQFWSELGAGEQPAIDFTRDVAIVVSAGQRPSGGYEIAVDRVSQADGELSIEVVERTPGPNCMTSASVTQPVDVVVVPAAAPRSWNFVERKEVRGCR